MKFEVYQIIVPIIGLLVIAMTVRQHLLGKNTFFETSFWIAFWIFVSLIAIFPDPITVFISKTLGIKDNINAIIFTGLALSFFIHFNMFMIIKKQNRTITELVRTIAIQSASKDG